MASTLPRKASDCWMMWISSLSICCTSSLTTRSGLTDPAWDPAPPSWPSPSAPASAEGAPLAGAAVGSLVAAAALPAGGWPLGPYPSGYGDNMSEGSGSNMAFICTLICI
eukprot:1180957-Prorocentrum_minimum.AAC.5